MRKKGMAYTGLWVVLMAGLMTASCAGGMQRKIQVGEDLMRRGDREGAVAHYEALLKAHPEDETLRSRLLRAHMDLYLDHLSRARRLRAEGKSEEARQAYSAALKVFPDNASLRLEWSDWEKSLKPGSQEALNSQIEAPVVLDVEGSRRVDLKLSRVPVSQIFQTVGRTFGINIIFDKEFRDFVHSIETRGNTLDEVLNQLCLMAGAGYRILDPHTILVFTDSPFKRKQFETRGIHYFTLAHIPAAKAKDALMALFRDEQVVVQEDERINGLVVRGSERALREIEQFLAQVDQRRREVILDVAIIEVNRGVVQKLGSDLGVNPVTLQAGVVNPTDGTLTQAININDLSSTQFVATVPSVLLKFLESGDRNRIVARPNLRGVDGEDISFMVGDEIPIPTTRFLASAAGGVNTIPQTTYEYKNVGIKVNMTPTIHQEGEVTLKIKLTMDFITGTNEDKFPLLGKRELENTIRLREGETNIIGGFLRDEERRSLNGVPGLSRLPILGRLFGNTQDDRKQTDLIFSVTPHIVHQSGWKDMEPQTIWSGEQQNGGGTGSVAAGGEDGDRAQQMLRAPMAVPGQTPEGGGSGSGIRLMPQRLRIRKGQDALLMVRMMAAEPVQGLSLNLGVQGSGVEIVAFEPIAAPPEKVLQDVKPTGVTLGFTLQGQKQAMLGRLKIRALGEGEATLSVSGINAQGGSGQAVELDAGDATVEVTP